MGSEMCIRDSPRSWRDCFTRAWFTSFAQGVSQLPPRASPPSGAKLLATEAVLLRGSCLVWLRATGVLQNWKRRVAEAAEFFLKHFLCVLRASAFQNSFHQYSRSWRDCFTRAWFTSFAQGVSQLPPRASPPSGAKLLATEAVLLRGFC